MEQIEADIYDRLSKVIDPELGRSVTELGMIPAIEVSPVSDGVYDVTVHVELTVEGCPLSDTITHRINAAVASYPDADLIPHIEISTMDDDKLVELVNRLKAERRQNPFTKPGSRTRIFAIASGKGGVGKSSVTANLAATFAALGYDTAAIDATFAALGYDTAAIDADIYGFSLPSLFGVHSQPTNLNGMLMPVTAWGVKLISIGMFAGADRAILWRGPRLQRSLEQFLSDVWWGEPDVLLLDLAPGTGDMAISVAQTLPNAELVVVTTPQPSASDVAVFSLPSLFGVHSQPTNLNGMLMPVTAWGVKLISIGMFAGADRAILWRGPRLQRSLEQFLSDVWWGEPDVLLLDLAPGTGDMAISVAQTLPNAELVVVTTPQPSASDVAVRSGLVALQVPMTVRGVVENMSWFDYKGERLEIFGNGGGERVSDQLTRALGYEVPLMGQLPLVPEIRETGESGRPAVLNRDGSLRTDGLGRIFKSVAERLMA